MTGTHADAEVYAWMVATGRGYLAAAKLAAKHFDIPVEQARDAYRAAEAAARVAYRDASPQAPAMPPNEHPPAIIPRPQYEPGTIAWHENQLRALQAAFDRAVNREDRVDAQGVASLGRALRDSADRVFELRERERANSSAGLTLEQRRGRLAEAARKAPMPLLEIWVLEWCTRNRIDMDQLRQARLVRAEEG